MGAWDVKQQRLHLLADQLGHCVIIVLLLFGLGNVSFVHCDTDFYWTSDLDVFQKILVAWSATPDISSNLLGWDASQSYPCQSLGTPDSLIPNWRGVQCMRHDYNATSESWFVDIVGLSISNASIVGYLPPDIGNLTWMITLELTGNRNLTGPLPTTLGNMGQLNVLDVHDNGFTGAIPDLSYVWNLLQLDLSGNQFVGAFPYIQISTMHYLQTLSIGDNLLKGDIPTDAFENKTGLDTLDISNNSFTGALPNLTGMQYLRYLDVSNNNFIGALPNLIGMQYLRYLDVSGNQLTGQIPDLTQFPFLTTANFARNNFTASNILDALWNPNAISTALTTVDLSSNHLTGPLSSWNAPPNISLGIISELNLDNNTLSGTLDITKMFAWGLLPDKSSPDFCSSCLRIMSLRNNRIEQVISDPYDITHISTVFRLDGNPYCDNYRSKDDAQRMYCTQTYNATSAASSDHRKIAIIATVSSVLAVAFILLVVVAALLLKTRRYRHYLQLQFEQKLEEFDVNPTIYTYNDLKTATRDFHEDTKLGQGGYGAVYKGVMPNGNVVAVKQLFIKTAQGLDEFLNEVVLITGMRHRNLVNLKGCCLREHQKLLIYEYVDNYDVDKILLGPQRQLVSWVVRLKICLGIARGLHYLHALAHPRVIHRDIKASNILLDNNMEPKIADFGLAFLFPDEQTHIMTVHVAGTKGYLAPEYASLGQLSDKVDVYSFGILGLEIISGRRNIDETRPLDEVYLSQWVWNLYREGRLMELVDPEIQLTDEEMRDVQRVINICLLCIQHEAEKRPTMARIVSILQRDTESEVQVVGEGQGERPLYEALRSQISMDDKNGFESAREEGCSSNGYHGNSHRGSLNDLSIVVEVDVINAR